MEYAIGINIKGQEIKFKIEKGQVYCYNNNLTSLKLPQGVKSVNCYNNNLTSVQCFA